MNPLTWRVLGASVQGIFHQQVGLPCQDFHDYRLMPGGQLVIAVADGVGSAQRAAAGAQCAAQEAIAFLQSVLNNRCPANEDEWHAAMTKVFHEGHEALDRLASAENTSLDAFASTLLCVVASDAWLVVGHIGSDALVAWPVEGSLYTAARPQRGEHVEQTYCLTMPDYWRYVEVQVYPQQTHALAVMTDGLVDLSLRLAEEYAPHPGFFDPLFSFMAKTENEEKAQEQLLSLLTSERMCSLTTDDKTLVLAVRQEPLSLPQAALPG